MPRFATHLIFAGILALETSCTHLGKYEEYEYSVLKSRLEKAGLSEIERKKAAWAGVLNILPAGGNIYLGQWGPGGWNLVGGILLWPLSIVWSVPQAIRDADVINKRATLEYYTVGAGKALLASKEASGAREADRSG